jgi:predicted enzyme related to lactoylglutathione lyase
MDAVVHFEVPADDLSRAKKFYTEVFGWKLTDVPEMNYVIAETTPTKDRRPVEPGGINGGMVKRDAIGKTPLIVINVDSIDQTVQKLQQAGGKVVQPKVAVGTMGHYARVTDSEGNTIGLWE